MTSRQAKWIIFLLTLCFTVTTFAVADRVLQATAIKNLAGLFKIPAAGTYSAEAGPTINMLAAYNAKAEFGITDWTKTGSGTFTTTTTVADVGNGVRSFSWDPSAASECVNATAITIPSGLKGGQCEATFMYKGFDNTVEAQIYNGTTVLEKLTLAASTGYTWASINYACASSGTNQFRLCSTGNSAIGYWDEVHNGSPINAGQGADWQTQTSVADNSGSLGAGAVVQGTLTNSTQQGIYSYSAGTYTFLKEAEVDATCMMRQSATQSQPQININGTAVSLDYVNVNTAWASASYSGHVFAGNTLTCINGVGAGTSDIQKFTVRALAKVQGTTLRVDPAFDTTGMLVPFGNATCPAGTIEANGAAVSRTLYPQLFAKYGTTYGVGDGSTTFNVINTGGLVLRGAGASTISSLGYSASLGTYQTDAFQSHTHEENTGSTTQNIGLSPAGNSFFAKMVGASSVNNANSNGQAIAWGAGAPRTDQETRMANVGVKYCIVTNGQRPMPVLAEQGKLARGGFASTTIANQGSEGSETRQEFSSVIVDTLSATAGTITLTTNSRFTASAEGIYRFFGQAGEANTSNTSATIIKIFKNGVQYNGRANRKDAHAANVTFDFNDVVPMSAGDYIDLRIFQNSGGVRAYANGFWVIEKVK